MARTAKQPKLTDEQLDYMASPSGFAKHILNMDLYPKQKAIVDAIAPEGASVVVRSCNEFGKTSRVAVVATLWHLYMFPGKVVSTSGASRQIQDQLVPALARHRNTFPSWHFMKVPRIECTDRHGAPDPNRFYAGHTTNDAGKMEGYHGENSQEPLLIIIDEAKTVPDFVFQAVERCKAHRLLVLSSPGDPTGEFYQAFGKRKDSYTDHFVATALDCPHISPEWIAKMEKKWGKEHPLVRSMIYAEFMENMSDTLIKLKDLDACLANPPAHKAGERKAHCDFAAGGDENVLAYRDGNKVTIVDAWREKDTTAACGRFAMHFHKLGLRPSEISGDASGMGIVMINNLADMGWPIVHDYSQSAPIDDHFANRVAESWVSAARQIELNEVILPDNDEDLRGQLLSRKSTVSRHGKILLESKDDMRRRGLPSPDRADAVIGAMAKMAGGPPSVFKESREDGWLDEVGEENSALAGFSC